LILGLEDNYLIGTDSFFDSVSPEGQYGVVFEDNTETGYFYAVDMENGQQILDALHIYNVVNVVDKDKPRKIQIAWDGKAMIASLLINNYCHAIFDFQSQSGYCRNGFPDTNSNWSKNRNRFLTDRLIEEIFGTV
jgi:hypothetical protein